MYMGKKIVRVTDNKQDALDESKAINDSLKERNIRRETYVTPVSQSYVRKLTRKGYPVKKRNYAIAVRNIR